MTTLSVPVPKTDVHGYLLFVMRVLWIGLLLIALLPLHLIWHLLKLTSP